MCSGYDEGQLVFSCIRVGLSGVAEMVQGWVQDTSGCVSRCAFGSMPL